MSIEPGSVEHLSQLISHVVAPAFLLAAVGSFISLLSDRLMAVVARTRDLERGEDPEFSGQLRDESIIRLRKRATLLNVSIFFGILSGLSALTLIIAAFTAALLEIHHVWLAAVLFIFSALFLLCSVITFGIDVKMAITGHDLH